MANVSDGDIGGNDWKDDSDGTRWKDGGGGGGCETLIGVSAALPASLLTLTLVLMIVTVIIMMKINDHHYDGYNDHNQTYVWR